MKTIPIMPQAPVQGTAEEDDRYIPINKGHDYMDTPERIASFNRKLASGWEEEYAEYRQLWSKF